jgi:hypothetical protein
VKDIVKEQSSLTTNGKDHIDGAPEDNNKLYDISA